jgi:uncharacterized LabA/DUF88 family protein
MMIVKLEAKFYNPRHGKETHDRPRARETGRLSASTQVQQAAAPGVEQARRPAEEDKEHMSGVSSPPQTMDRITYAFIDGNNVRAAQNRAMKEVFGVPGDLAPDRIAPTSALRTYFYDCLDDLKRASETEEEFKSRVEAQEEVLSQVHSRPGLHFRFGTLKGGRRRAQKEVDILLAVDMLTHGFNRNMSHAILVSGDLDFRPMVEALVRGGVFVEVWYEKRSGAKELPAAADFGVEIGWQSLYNWNSDAFRQVHTPPAHMTAHEPVMTAVFARAGSYEGRRVEMMKSAGYGPFILRVEMSEGVHWFEHQIQEVLDRYFSMLFGPIEWK